METTRQVHNGMGRPIKPCRNDTPRGCACAVENEDALRPLGVAGIGGACACTPERSIGADRNLCGCWPEPEAPKATRRACRCGAALSRFELRHGLQCSGCTRRDEALAGVGY